MVDTYAVDTLKNGLRVISVPMDTASVTALVLIGAGSRHERPKEAGMSHFLEHMMFKGTKKRPESVQIAREIEGIGGAWNAYTSKDHTGYWIKAAAKHLPFLIEMLSDMTLNSLLKQEEIDREKGVIIQEMNMYEDTPLRKVGEVFENVLYGKDTPLGRDIIGSEETVQGFQREDLVSYMGMMYRPSNAVVVVAGGVKSAANLAKKHFASWEDRHISSQAQNTNRKVSGSSLKSDLSGTEASFLQVGRKAFSEVNGSQTKPKLEIISKKTEQTHLCIGMRAYKRTDPRRFALSLLATVIGGGMSSRLFHEVRERRGLAYYIRSSVERFQDTGYLVTQAGVDVDKTEEAVKVIRDEYEKVTTSPSRRTSPSNRRASTKRQVSSKELARAREFIKGHLIMGFENSQAVAEVYGTTELLDNKIRTLKQTLKEIDKVKLEHVHEVAHDVFKKEKLNLSAIGPFTREMKEKLRRLLER